MPGPNTPCEISGRNIRLLAIDLDGTLLNDERLVTPGSAEAIMRARSSGVTVALASGRIFPSLRPFAEQLGLTGPFICANGAHILDFEGGEIAFKELDRAARSAVIDVAEAMDLHLNAYTRTELLLLRETEWSEMYRRRARAVVPRIADRAELLDAEISKMMLVGAPTDIAKIRAQIEPEMEALSVRLTESEPEYLEFLAPGAHKGAALEEISKRMGVARTETAAIGDYLNDVEMLSWAGFSAAVENAAEEAKCVSDVVVRSNEEGGVVQFIDSHILNGRE